MKILSTHNLLCQKFAAPVGKLQLNAQPTFLNQYHN